MKTSGIVPIKLTKINPKTYKKLPKLFLDYCTTPTKFGKCFSVFHNNALCYLKFYEEEPPFEDLKKIWNNASLSENAAASSKIDKFFQGDDSDMEICLKGTDFEMEVWEALLNVKKGTTVSYEEMANAINRPKAVRAVAGG